MNSKLRAIFMAILICLACFCLLSCDKNGGTSQEELTTYKITYVLDGGTAVNQETYTKDTASFTLTNPVKEGYTFIGWTYVGQDTPVKTVLFADFSGDVTFTAHYEKWVAPTTFEPLKVAVFADVQLAAEKNLGSTANSYLALVDHFKYTKSIDADVLFMVGDIVNNAVENYYVQFMQAFECVYGTEESKYPEFVWTMGNHEWWNTSEQETENAVSMFYDYARVNTDNLVSQSAVPYAYDRQTTLPSYYKVINGVPFVSISGENSVGYIGSDLRTEIEGWLKDISMLDSVRAGGPIYVGYHYGISDVTYFGQGTNPNTIIFNDIFKDYPTAIVFTGDTHYPSVNERTINQVDYTSINIGSASYSRMANRSATSELGEKYYNFEKGSGGKSTDTMRGEVNFMYEYTPSLMVVDFNENGSSSINRYFSAKDLSDVKHIGIEWTIPLKSNKQNFVYTDERFKSTEWANTLYGANGLSWADGKTVTFNVDGDRMMVYFDDVIDYNCCEHYKIAVIPDGNAEGVKYYDFVTHYYKYDDNPHVFHCVLSDIPQATTYTVTVKAYDFFDNVSLNELTATDLSESVAFGDDIDLQTLSTYSDISKKANYEVKAEGSESSVEYYYKGTYNFKAGALLNRTIYTSGVSLVDYVSIEDWSHGVLTMDVKNPNAFELYMCLTVVVFENGKDKWLTDGGTEYRISVPQGSDWTNVKWDLLAQFGITSKDDIKQIALKIAFPSSAIDTVNGYEVSFFIDNYDIKDYTESGDRHENAFAANGGEAIQKTRLFGNGATTSDTVSFEYKLVNPNSADNTNSVFAFIIFDNKNWNNYIDYIRINAYSNTAVGDCASYVSIAAQDDGWYKVTIDLSAAKWNGTKQTEYVFTAIYAMSNRINCNVLLDLFTVE